MVELIENNPITKLSQNYNGKLLTKIKEGFNDFEQQLFVSSFYCYLNYNSKTDFVVDLDNIWKWLGFSQKVNAKTLLEKQFTIDIDYTKSLLLQQKLHIKGGQNKETFMLTIKTFKSFCLKAGTKKADEIHEYYMKMEEIIQDTINEESNELKLQLEQKNIQLQNKTQELEQHKQVSELEKEKLLEQTLISQFPINTECIYYGKIDNKTLGKENSKMYHENLIKFGQSNNLAERIKCHKKNFLNFKLIAAFKVKNKIQIENAIKKHPILSKRIRSITVENPNYEEENYRELIALDNEKFTIENIDKYIKEVIKENEYNIENYNLLVEKNYQLEIELKNIKKENKEKDENFEKINLELQKYKPDSEVDFKSKIASNFSFCKYGYYLYAFECEEMRYKCSIVRQKDFETLSTNLKQIDNLGEMKYYTKVSYPFSEKVMAFLLKQTLTNLGNIKYEGTFENIKKILDITAKLENVLIDNSKDLDKLYNILDGTITIQNDIQNEVDPEVPIIKKSKRSIDQINKDTHEVIKTYESIEAAGRSLGVSGQAIGISLREKRVCQGFLWRYTGISKEDQYLPQPVIKVCCSTGEKFCFQNIADAAKDCNISAPGLRNRIILLKINNLKVFKERMDGK